MLRLAFGRPWRQTEGMLGSIMDLLGPELPVPDHTTFSRRSADLSVATALKKASGPVHVVIGSTGLKVFGAGDWLHDKHGGKPRRGWRKLHLAVDPDSGEILASELTTTDDGDAFLVGPPLDQIDCPISTVFTYGAYDGEPIYRSVAGHTPDATVIIPPRSTAVPGATAETAPTRRDQHIEVIEERGRLGWQGVVDYGKRSLAEVAMFRCKKVIGRGLHARTLPTQKTEAKIACKVQNIMTCLGMPVFRRLACPRRERAKSDHPLVSAPKSIVAAYPPQIPLPAKIRLFIAWLRKIYAQPDYWTAEGARKVEPS
jgi:hypothetical protein